MDQKELHKVFFQHEMTYEYFQDFPRRAALDKVLRGKVYNIA